MTHDRTRSSLIRQLKGLGLELLEVTRKGPEHSGTSLWTPAEILQNLPRLKRWNAAGCDIYVRGPREQDHDLILLDDLDRFTIDRMSSNGHPPAVFTETSPGNCQAWLRLGKPVPAELRLEIARNLAMEYGGDPGAVGAHQAGRLVGFTNRKPKHKTARGFPFAMLLNAPGTIMPSADRLIAAARVAATIHEKKQRTARASRSEIEVGDAPDRIVDAWLSSYEKSGDLSATDWSNTNRCLAVGVPAKDLVAVLGRVASRKGRSADDYARRTVLKAIKHQEEKASTPSPD